MQEVRRVIRASILPYTPAAKSAAFATTDGAITKPAATAQAKPENTTVDAQGDVCMAPGAEESSMYGNSTNAAATAATAGPPTVTTGANGRVSAPESADAMEEDTPLQGRLVTQLKQSMDEARAPLSKASTEKDGQIESVAVKLSAAPPLYAGVEGAAEGVGKVEAEEVAPGKRLEEEEFRALQGRASTLQV